MLPECLGERLATLHGMQHLAEDPLQLGVVGELGEGREASIERGLSDLAWVSERALPHEAIIEFVGRSGTVLPMKLFTLFRTDLRARAHVTEARQRWQSLLRRVASDGARDED